MTEVDIRANVAEFIRHGRNAEADEASAQAHRWEQARLAAEALDGGWTERQYAEAVGAAKTTIHVYVGVWRRFAGHPGDQRPRFADAYNTVRMGSDEIVTTGERGRRERERQEPTRHDDRVEMAAKLLADPTVAKEAVPRVLATPAPARSEPARAQRHIKQAVSQAGAHERRRALEEAQRKAQATAAPLPAFMARIVLKVNEMAAALAQLRGDFAALPEGRNRELVVHALKQLDEQVARILVEMDEVPPGLGENVIEGRVA
jgi:hypothetical protein